jgi:hypothetical protein
VFFLSTNLPPGHCPVPPLLSVCDASLSLLNIHGHGSAACLCALVCAFTLLRCLALLVWVVKCLLTAAGGRIAFFEVLGGMFESWIARKLASPTCSSTFAFGPGFDDLLGCPMVLKILQDRNTFVALPAR